jgi:hypothetical protein
MLRFMSHGSSKPSSSVRNNGSFHRQETDLNIALALATTTIITRSIFRAIELSDGFSGAMANNELLYMILEPPMISIAVIALTLCHPGVCFQGSWSSAKSAYKDARQKLYSKVFSDENTANGMMISREGVTEMETFSKNI